MSQPSRSTTLGRQIRQESMVSSFPFLPSGPSRTPTALKNIQHVALRCILRSASRECSMGWMISLIASSESGGAPCALLPGIVAGLAVDGELGAAPAPARQRWTMRKRPGLAPGSSSKRGLRKPGTRRLTGERRTDAGAGRQGVRRNACHLRLLVSGSVWWI